MNHRWQPRASCWAAALFGCFGCGLVVDTSLPAACVLDAECPSGGACVEGSCRLGLAAACDSNSECRDAGSQYCVNGQCIQDLASTDCSVWPEDALERESNKLLLGFIGDLTTGYGTPPLQGVQLAFQDDVNIATDGLPASGGGTRRDLALLICDEGKGSQPYAVQKARELVELARVPAIIGASYSSNTQEIWEQYIKPQGSTLLISPSATSPDLTTATEALGDDPDNLLWRTVPSDLLQVQLLKDLTLQVIERVRSSGRPNPRMLLYYKKDSAGIGLFNGLTDALLSAGVPPPSTVNDYDVELSAEESLNQALVALNETPPPDIIVGLGTIEFVQSILPKIEEGWPTGVPRPWYLLPEGTRADVLKEYAATPSADPTLRQRLIGTAPGARQSPNYLEFKEAFESANLQNSPGNLAEFGYDAAYLLVYAIVRANQPYPDGLQLARALSELTCPNGTPLTPRSEGRELDDQFVVAQGPCVDFSGASGELAFNSDGETPSDIASWCLRPDGNGFSYEPPLSVYYDSVNNVTVNPADNPLDLSNPNWCPPVLPP